MRQMIDEDLNSRLSTRDVAQHPWIIAGTGAGEASEGSEFGEGAAVGLLMGRGALDGRTRSLCSSHSLGHCEQRHTCTTELTLTSSCEGSATRV